MSRKKAKRVRTTRQLIVSYLKRGMSNADALANLKRARPETTFSLATVNWYRNKLRGEGVKIPTEHEARSRKSA